MWNQQTWTTDYITQIKTLKKKQLNVVLNENEAI